MSYSPLASEGLQIKVSHDQSVSGDNQLANNAYSCLHLGHYCCSDLQFMAILASHFQCRLIQNTENVLLFFVCVHNQKALKRNLFVGVSMKKKMSLGKQMLQLYHQLTQIGLNTTVLSKLMMYLTFYLQQITVHPISH